MEEEKQLGLKEQKFRYYNVEGYWDNTNFVLVCSNNLYCSDTLICGTGERRS